MMTDDLTPPLAIYCLSQGSLSVARRLRDQVAGAVIFGLEGRVAADDVRPYRDFGGSVRDAFCRGLPLVCLCAAGIVIRTLAPVLQDKRGEPPVLAVAEDGSAVVPLLGGLNGVNDLARRLAAGLTASGAPVAAAITTSGELRFGLALENPPLGYVLANPEAGKKFMSDLLAGAVVKVSGNADWLSERRFPRYDPTGGEVWQDEELLHLTVTPLATEPRANELIFHPQALVVVLTADGSPVEDVVRAAGYSPQAVAAVLALADLSPTVAVARAGRFPLRFLDAAMTAEAALVAAVAAPVAELSRDGLVLREAPCPAAVVAVGRRRGSLTVVGLGPGSGDLMAPAVKESLLAATDVIGYIPYVEMARPYLSPQATVHPTDNRVEIDRARHAFSLAAEGAAVVVVSSGDPGIFAMAAAVLEAYDRFPEPAWDRVRLEILPGITAAQAASARMGAILGHDLTLMSLSDNLKPWEVIVRRLHLAAEADLVIALYNPISRARPWQLAEAIAVLRQHRRPQTPVVLGRDVGRPGERMQVVTLGALTPEMVDMRTVVVVGSSLTRCLERAGRLWVYSPRWYRGDMPDEKTAFV